MLGADIAPAILTGAWIIGQMFHPTVFSTIFGWILMGSTTPMKDSRITSLFVITDNSLELALIQFWKMEEPPNKHNLSPDEVHAEAIFTSSIKLLSSGRFSVALPFKHPRLILRNSKGMALRRYHYLEHHLSRDASLKQQYFEFIRDYLDSQHMELIPMVQRNTTYCYYIPHHCILRSDSQTTCSL